jgi:hypothetical protein
MNFDRYWLDDQQMIELSERTPSTEFGRELMSEWPSRYPTRNSSAAYHGYATALWVLVRHVTPQACTNASITAAIQVLDASVKESIQEFHESKPDFDDYSNVDRNQALGAAALALLNSWERTQCGADPQDLVGLYESEAIYAARKFREARESTDGFA